MTRYKIVDWYVHQGHQYEFFKAPHDFYLIDSKGGVPKWNKKHRPLGSNVNLISEEEAKKIDFDIAIIRTPIPSKRYGVFISKGAAPIAVIQTTEPINLDRRIGHVVWNSKEAMKKKITFYKGRKIHNIIHGYDPDEFKILNLEKNGRVLTVANHFKKRAHIMGFDIWSHVNKKTKICDVVGSKNEEITGSIDHFSNFEDLIKCYNSYSIYFNPTRNSAMPRSRAEAAMCGMPIISTMNYDFKNYFKPGIDALLSNNRDELARYIKQMSESEQMRIDYGMRSRELAIKHFHIKDFIAKWERVFYQATKRR